MRAWCIAYVSSSFRHLVGFMLDDRSQCGMCGPSPTMAYLLHLFLDFCNRFGARAAIFKVLCVQPCRRLGFRGLGRIQSANSKIS